MTQLRTRSGFARGPAALLLGLAVQSATTYIVLILCGRVLGAARFGALSALYVMIASLATGLFLPLEQEVARRRGAERARSRTDRHLLARASRLGLVLSAGAIVVLLAAYPVTNGILGEDPQLVAALCVSIPGYALCFVSRGEFAGQRALARYGVQLGVEGGFRLVAAVGLAIAGIDDTAPYAWLFGAAPWVALAVSLIGWRMTRMVPAEPHSHEAGLIRDVGWLVVSCLASQLLINAGPLVVAVVADSTERATVGVYLAALVLIRIPVILFTAVQPSFLPAMAERAAGDRRAEFIRLTRTVLGWATAVAVLVVVMAVAIGPSVVKLLFGFEQQLSRWTFFEATTAVGLFLLATIVAQTLVSRGRHAATTAGWLAGLVGLAAGTTLGSNPVDRASNAFLVGAATAIAVLGCALYYDLSHWASVDRDQIGRLPSKPSSSARPSGEPIS